MERKNQCRFGPVINTSLCFAIVYFITSFWYLALDTRCGFSIGAAQNECARAVERTTRYGGESLVRTSFFALTPSTHGEWTREASAAQLEAVLYPLGLGQLSVDLSG